MRPAEKRSLPTRRGEQLTLPFDSPRERLRRRLRPLLDGGMVLVDNSNGVNLFSFQTAAGITTLRVSDRLAEAPIEVLRDVVAWARGGPGARRAAQHVRTFISRLPHRPSRRRAPKLVARGEVHDLSVLLAKVSRTQFRNVELKIRAVGWGAGRRHPERRSGSIRLASFQETTRTVRVHPALDQELVPSWVIEFLLFHELLHAEIGHQKDAAGHHRYHTPEFRRRERRHPDHDRFLAWQNGPLQSVLARWDRHRR
jgi:hypothetical protein